MRLLSALKRISPDVQGGLALLLATLVALTLANSPLAPFYHSIGGDWSKALLFFVNDGLMALFFLVVGLEIRREFLDGELNSFAKSALPAIAALGGMVVPALIYLAITRGDAIAQQGFAIPVATDIAFAIGVLSLFGRRVPVSLKAFLTALAIFDDIGAIVVIALVYNDALSLTGLVLAITTVITMLELRRRKIAYLPPYLALALLLWIFTTMSGVHSTIAGVVAAFLLPAEGAETGHRPSAYWLKHHLHPYVTFLILPLFAFLNAGVSFSAGLEDLFVPVSLGTCLGLFFGKSVGIFISTWLCVRFRFSPKPFGATWPQVFGVATICGIGFTMSFFVGMLAFEKDAAVYQTWVRTGVLLGSLLSALVGSAILHFSLRKTQSLHH